MSRIVYRRRHGQPRGRGRRAAKLRPVPMDPRTRFIARVIRDFVRANPVPTDGSPYFTA